MQQVISLPGWGLFSFAHFEHFSEASLEVRSLGGRTMSGNASQSTGL
jgi:hypothetical protein